MADDFPADGPGLDLFGHAITAIRDRRGRPSFKKDKENQDFVMVRVAAGWSQKRIADDMGIDEKTLRKHFSRELEAGGFFIEGLVLDVLLKGVRRGHSPSVRQMREVLAAAGPQAPRGRASQVDDEDDDEPALGKKEQRLQDAQNVPAEYGDIFAKMGRRLNG